MERESNQMQAPPALCRSGCGFYGSPATDGLCSICYKEALKKKQQPPATSGSVPSATERTSTNFMSNSGSPSPGSAIPSSIDTAQPTVPVISPVSSGEQNKEKSNETEGAIAATAESSAANSGEAEDGEGKDLPDKDGKKKKNRCAVCRKKVGLTGFLCRCGGLFCAVHRYSDKHDCTFDYREMGAQEIRRNNPVVVGEKIQKI